jgi:RNA polymerase sigma factor (sigma-70 family)
MNCNDLEQQVHNAQKGNKEAQLWIVQQYMPYIAKRAKAYKVKSFSCQDLLQLGTLAVLKAIHKYKIGSNTFKGYVIRAINSAFAYAWRESKKQWMDESLSRLDKTYIDSRTNYYGSYNVKNSFVEELIYKEEILQLRDDILRLTPGEISYIRRLFYKNMSLKQLAQEEAISYSQAVRRKNRIIDKLAKLSH